MFQQNCRRKKLRHYPLFILFLILFFFKPHLLYSLTMSVDPLEKVVENIDVIFQVNIRIDDWSVENDISSATAYIRFDPNYLKVTDSNGQEITALTPNSEFPYIVENEVNNNEGIIKYTAVVLGGCEVCKSTPVNLVSIYFKTIVSKGKANIEFLEGNCYVGVNVSCGASGNPYTISPSVNNGRVLIGDIEPPQITTYEVTDITRSAATIVWNTSEPATSQVCYGLTVSRDNCTVMDTNLVQTHSVELSDLKPLTTYYYQIRTQDEAENLTTLEDKFQTNDKDAASPKIEHSPITNAVVNQDIKILTTVTDDVSVDKVWLNYKKSTDVNWSKVEMVVEDLQDFSAVIPSSIVTTDGVDYYLEAKDTAGNVSYSPESLAGENFYQIKVTNKVGVLKGQVLEKDVNTPVVDVLIQISGTTLSITTSTQGDYEINNVPVGTYSIVASKSGYISETKTAEIYENQTTNLDFSLQKSGTIQGSVTDYSDSSPISSARIIIASDLNNSTYYTYSSSDGTYLLTGFAGGDYKINIEKAGYDAMSPENLPQSISVGAGEVKTFNFTLKMKSVTNVQVTPSSKIFYPGQTTQFSVRGWTEDMVEVILTQKEWRVQPYWIGTIDRETGFFKAGELLGSGYIIVEVIDKYGNSSRGFVPISISNKLDFQNIYLIPGNHPFNPVKDRQLTIRYNLTQDVYQVVIKIFTLRGRLIRTIYGYSDSDISSGKGVWDGRDETGRFVQNGIYVFQITATGTLGTVHSKPKLIGVIR